MIRKHESLLFRETLAKKHPCFVLITCDPPTETGNMNVEMSFEGDPALAALMLRGAQSYLEESEIERDPKTRDEN